MNPHGANQSGEQKLQQSVEQQVRRIKKADQERRTLLSQTMYLGAIGVMLALPIVAGAYLGRWLDTLMQGYAVRWTVSMIFLGIIVGAVNVYLFVRE